MKKITLHPLILLSFALLSPSMIHAAEPAPFYKTQGTDPTFAEVITNGKIKPSERFSKGPVLGSRIEVNNELLEKQVGKTTPIPKDIGLHTQGSGGINRKEFDQWTRWYQEDGNVQIFRLFQGEQNIRSGAGKDGSPGRVETYSKSLTVTPGAWREWEATYTIIKPVQANIFQLFHEGKDARGNALLWAFHIRMSDTGGIYFSRRRSIAGLEDKITLAENAVGKSLSIKVRANGEKYEVYQKSPLDAGDWKLVTTGHYAKSQENKVSFRWGMYCGSKKGLTVGQDALLFVNGITIR